MFFIYQLRALAPKFALTGVAAMAAEAATFPIGARQRTCESICVQHNAGR